MSKCGTVVEAILKPEAIRFRICRARIRYWCLLVVLSLLAGIQTICANLAVQGGKFEQCVMASGTIEQATFAAGCFWSVELAFQRVTGVTKTAVGYTHGAKKDPTYNEVCSGKTGHAEAVLLEYDNGVVSYEKLLDVFWKKHDPTQRNRQGNDVGSQYRSGIYFHTAEQEKTALASLKATEEKLGKKVATEVLPAKEFYLAEDYHQQYLEKGGRNGRGQCAAKGCNDTIRCYG